MTEKCSHKFLHGNKENCPFRGKKCASSYWPKNPNVKYHVPN